MENDVAHISWSGIFQFVRPIIEDNNIILLAETIINQDSTSLQKKKKKENNLLGYLITSCY